MAPDHFKRAPLGFAGTQTPFMAPEIPETITQTLEDGCVCVIVGDITGVVSSFHLVEPKANQLRKVWLDRYLLAANEN